MTNLPLPGGRDARATLDEPGAETEEHGGVGEGAPTACAVACPPHPRHGGTRSDRRLAAVSDALGERGIACLRFDYGAWDEGIGEREDARNAVRWAADRYDRVGVFGYSFGGTIALCAGATVDRPVGAVSALAPAAAIDPDLDAVAAIDALGCPVQVLYGERDDTVAWEPVVERAREADREAGDAPREVVAVPADHHFVGQGAAVAEDVGTFFDRRLGE